MNMKYCQFENTFKAWQECKESLEECTVSKEEEKYVKFLLEDVLELMLEEGIIESYDEEELKLFVKSNCKG